MTSRSSCYRAIPAEKFSTPLASVVDVIDGDIGDADAELKAASARRKQDGTEAGGHKTTAGLLAGLFLCACSSALVIWLAMLLL